MLSDIKICANSTFSLMSCYLNDIYNFKPESKYVLPDTWFTEKGPDYDIQDLIPIESEKFITINENITPNNGHTLLNFLYLKSFLF